MYVHVEGSKLTCTSGGCVGKMRKWRVGEHVQVEV